MYQFSGKKRSFSEARGAKRPSSYKIKKFVKSDITRRPTRFNLTKNIESHFVDSGQVTSNCDTTGQIQLINTIAQGTTVNQRIGKKLLLQSVRIQAFFQPGTTAIYNNLGAYLVLDRQSNGAAIPAITDILVSVNTNDFPNDAKRSRYKILRRWDCVVSGCAVAATNPANDLPSLNCNDYIPLKFVMEYNTSATTGVQATIEKGALYIVTVGSAAAGNTAGTFQFYTRTRFTEDF
jgi:hypothetical protein